MAARAISTWTTADFCPNVNPLVSMGGYAGTGPLFQFLKSMDSHVVSTENRENASAAANAAQAQYDQAVAQLDVAKLNLEHTRVASPVDGYVPNLQV